MEMWDYEVDNENEVDYSKYMVDASKQEVKQANLDAK